MTAMLICSHPLLFSFICESMMSKALLSHKIHPQQLFTPTAAVYTIGLLDAGTHWPPEHLGNTVFLSERSGHATLPAHLSGIGG